MIKIQNKVFFYLTLTVFLIEVLIATLFKNTFLRPVFADFLVLILIYSFFRGLPKIKPIKLGVSVLLFAYLIEVFQMINIRDLMGISKSTLSDLTLGTSFDWNDIVAYSFGIILIFLTDKYLISKTTTQII